MNGDFHGFMMGIFIAMSILIKLFSLLIILYAFRTLSIDESGKFGVYTQLFIMRRRYDLLRMSLLFIAAILVLELVSMSYTLISRQGLNLVQIMASDILFIGLVALVTIIYSSRNSLKKV
jgi:hypothetical protein